jgi:hypothetical protein
MFHSLITRLRIWHLRQLSHEAYGMLLSSRNPITRGAIRSNIRDYEDKIRELQKASQSVQRLHG